MLKKGQITINYIAFNKEAYKKIMNFANLVSILYCGDAVKIVKRIGSLESKYLLYLDHRPKEIVHLGLVEDNVGVWHPEPFLVLQRNVTAYIDGQLLVDILDMSISDKPPGNNAQE